MNIPDSFSFILGEASATYPRNTEGDVIALRDGRLLASWSRFYGGTRDSAGAHIAARLSSDGGGSWGEPFILQENVGQQNVMSASFLREREPGDILLFYLVKNCSRDLKSYCRRSNDEAQSWGEPVLVTPADGYQVVNNARIINFPPAVCLPPSVSPRTSASLATVSARSLVTATTAAAPGTERPG